eukprot:Gb_31578 [translate_table: standard]
MVSMFSSSNVFRTISKSWPGELFCLGAYGEPTFIALATRKASVINFRSPFTNISSWESSREIDSEGIIGFPCMTMTTLGFEIVGVATSLGRFVNLSPPYLITPHLPLWGLLYSCCLPSPQKNRFLSLLIARVYCKLLPPQDGWNSLMDPLYNGACGIIIKLCEINYSVVFATIPPDKEIYTFLIHETLAWGSYPLTIYSKTYTSFANTRIVILYATPAFSSRLRIVALEGSWLEMVLIVATRKHSEVRRGKLPFSQPPPKVHGGHLMGMHNYPYHLACMLNQLRYPGHLRLMSTTLPFASLAPSSPNLVIPLNLVIHLGLAIKDNQIVYLALLSLIISLPLLCLHMSIFRNIWFIPKCFNNLSFIFYEGLILLARAKFRCDLVELLNKGIPPLWP